MPRWKAAVSGWMIAVACSALLLTACSLTPPSWWPFVGLPHAEDAARKTAPCPGADVRVHAVHDFPDGDRLLVYSGSCPPGPEHPLARPVRGEVLFEREGGSFRQSGTAEINNSAPMRVIRSLNISAAA